MTRKLFEISAVVIAIGLLLVFAQRTLGVHGYRLASGQPLFGDFIAFWSAGKAALEGHVAQIPTGFFWRTSSKALFPACM